MIANKPFYYVLVELDYCMINYTVIIPHFSKDGKIDLLIRALNSIPNRDDIEILIVDNSVLKIDFSLLEAQPTIKILYTDNKLGAGGARNKGIEEAHGKWLLFLDADDYYTPGAFSIIDDYVNANSDIIFFKPTSIFPKTGKIADRHLSYADLVDNCIITHNEIDLRLHHCTPWCKLISRNLVVSNNIKFDEVPASNDVMFALKIGLAADKILAVDKVVYCITVTDGSITKTETLSNIYSVFDVIVQRNKLLRSLGYSNHTGSVMNQIYRASKFGIRPCAVLIWKAVITNNLFVGWKNWGRTIRNKNK